MRTSLPVLLVSADPRTVEDVRRIGTVAGIEVAGASGAGEARGRWSSAPVVLVGEDVAASLAGALPRRSGVVVVARAEPGPEAWRAAVSLGAEDVVVLPAGERALVHRLASRPSSPGAEARVLGVIGGSGGAGASVLAVALALAVARTGSACALVDLDPESGGLDLALGAEDVAGARWSDLAHVRDVLTPDTVRSALPAVGGVAVLSVDRAATEALPIAAVPWVLDSVRRSTDVVVADLPRGCPDVLASVGSRCDEVLLVATPDVRGASSARRTRDSLRGLSSVRLVVRSLPGCDLDAGALADWLDLDLAAEVAHDRRMAAALDRGEPPGARRRSRLAMVCDALVASEVPS
jgi:secretion/DNA translocation related CpaE-like protein